MQRMLLSTVKYLKAPNQVDIELPKLLMCVSVEPQK